jgi:LysM repeat protein
MESQVKSVCRGLWPCLALGLLLALSSPALYSAQEKPAPGQEEEAAQLRLRKTPYKTREYQGKAVEGEERVVKRGDTLWSMLIREKGLSERRFGRYLVIISSLNPQVKKPDLLQVGQTIFIPIRPNEVLGIEMPASGKGEAKLYRVKQGDYLYKILREQFGVQEKKQLRGVVEQVKELNPRKKNWNLLFVGEVISFPGAGPSLATAPPEAVKLPEGIGLDYGRKLAAQDNLQLLEQVVTALGNELQRGGEEVVALQEGTVRIDRDSYPVIRNPKGAQKVILDSSGKIPASLKSKLDAPGSSTPVVSLKKGDNLHDAVGSLLSRLGYQSLPANRPVEIRDGGVGVQVKGEWMVAGLEESGGKQDVIIINLTDVSGRTPDYLRDYLSLRGMSLKEVLLPGLSLPTPPAAPASATQPANVPAESWPRDRSGLADALLKSFGIDFTSARQISVTLREGIRLDIKVDRLFDWDGNKIALVFRPVGEEAKKALQEREKVRVVELDFASLSSRDLLARLLNLLGEKSTYREHRFYAVEGAAKDRMVVSVAGFMLPSRSLLLTDREIPKGVHGLFVEKGIRVVRFQ